MRNFTLSFFRTCLIFSILLIPRSNVHAQCNVNEKYDKIISGYHSSIALKDNGVYAVWGSAMNSAGSGDVLSPQDINTTNYSSLTGTILKAALGGNKSGGQVDQAVLLTTTGLWAWGVEGLVVNNSLTSSAAFARITSPSGAATTGLPSGLTPDSVSSMMAAYQTLVILTKGGIVYVLTQASQTLEGNGASSAGSNQWKKVKINSTNDLANVIAVRAQVSSSSYNAMIALTSTGKVYTWGTTSYLGDGNAASSRNYATQMTLPSEFNGKVPKMIGVTGGTGSTSTTKNTYYILSNGGNLYALGDNTQKQCGDFTTTERLSWVNVKKNSSTNFSNVNTFSAQEHNSSYPGVAAITTDGDIYTWGNNSAGMLGRTSDNTSSGSASGNYDPGMPVMFNNTTDNAIFVEMGGHTMVYTKEGTSKFCYVGHQTNGSMGDGTATSAASNTTTLNHTCTSTPSLSICGYVPVAPQATNSVISASQTTIAANGNSTSVLTIRLKDANGNNLTSSGGIVTVSATNGTLGTVIDNNDGTYTVTLTSPNSSGSGTVSFAVNGTTSSSTATLAFTATLPLAWGSVTVSRIAQEVKIEWTTEQENNVSHFTVERSLNGTSWTEVGNNVAAFNLSAINHYELIDHENLTQQVFYRIKQVDLDGKFTYSIIKTLNADKNAVKITIYPVPASTKFYLNSSNAGVVKQVKMLNDHGVQVKQWSTLQAFYEISELPVGVYFIKVETSNGRVEQLRLNKY